MESGITNNINNNNGNNKNIQKFNCKIVINEHNYDVETFYNNEIISIIIENKDIQPFKIYKKTFIKNDFINISKYFRIFDNTFEIFEKINLFFTNNLFEGKFNDEEIVLKITLKSQIQRMLNSMNVGLIYLMLKIIKNILKF